MYHLVYGFLYAFSLLPWKGLYFISDFVYVLMYYVFGYRKLVVMANLLIAFPEKTEVERIKIAKEFYHNFLDTFIETLKFLSISEKDFNKRLSGNFGIFQDLYKSGQSVQIHSGHFFNWEYMNWGLVKYSPYPLLGVYAPIGNDIFNKIMLKIRGRYNTILIPTYTFKTSFHKYSTSQYALGLAADQAPHPAKGFWLPFFGKPAPFATGPEKGASVNNTAIVLVHFYKVKRGYYNADFKLLTTEPKSFARGELTKLYVDFLEKCIRKKPANYLWSHRRWKHGFSEEYRGNVI
ncbi:MAG TPA: lipid A biosynthesis acyltransferase [Segetibacter sp.]